MTKKLLAAATACAVLSATAFAQRDFSKVEITTLKVADGIYMLQGAGGNIGLSVGKDGAFVIDDQFAPLSEKILTAIAEVTDQPVEFVLNTHYHGDHTGGNEAFGEAGAHILAHDNVRKRLAEGTNSRPPSPDIALPVITFSHSTTFHWNDKEIYVFHPKNAHTDGDAIVHFRKSNVVHMGDVHFVGAFPYIDTAAGGSVDGYIKALEKVAAKIDDDTKVIPGHGPLASKADILASAAMLKDVRTRIQKTIDDGLDEDAAVAANPLAELADEWGGGFINAERMTRSVYQSLSK